MYQVNRVLIIARTGGYIINTPSHFSESLGYDILHQVVTVYKVDIILVIQNERLYNDVQRRYAENSTIDVVKVDKSGGVCGFLTKVVNRDKAYRKKIQDARIREYFYGTPTLNNRADLSPYSNIVAFSNVFVRRIGKCTFIIKIS